MKNKQGVPKDQSFSLSLPPRDGCIFGLARQKTAYASQEKIKNLSSPSLPLYASLCLCLHSLSLSLFLTYSTSAGVIMGPCPSDLSETERRFTRAIITAFDAAAPIRQIVLSSRRKPWVSAEIRSLMRTRDHAYRLARNSGSPGDLQNFRAARASASNALDSAKNRYIASRLDEAASPETKWKELRRLRVTGSGTTSPFRYFDTATLNTHFAAIVNRHQPIAIN